MNDHAGKTPTVVDVSDASQLFSSAHAMISAVGDKKTPQPLAVAPDRAMIQMADHSTLRADTAGNVAHSLGVFDSASTSSAYGFAQSDGRSVTYAARVNAAAIYASSELVSALMVYPGVKGGGSEREDEIIDGILSRAMQSTDEVMAAIGIATTHPRYAGHRNRLFRAQLDIMAKAHIARYVHEFAVEDVDNLSSLQVRIAQKIDRTEYLLGEGDQSFLDATLDIAVSKILAKVTVASALVDEMARSRFDFGVDNPLEQIAIRAAFHAETLVSQSAKTIMGDTYGQNRTNDGMVETALITAAADIYRKCFASKARELISSLDRMDEFARAAEFDKYCGGSDSKGWPTEPIHQEFARYFSSMVCLIAGADQSSSSSNTH